jgi:CHAD domain-containing protein
MTPVEAATPLWAAATVLLDERGRDFFRRRDQVLKTFDPEDIHDLRVASRRLREGLLLFAPCYPGDGLAWILKRIRKVTRLLGDIRNSDEAALFFATLADELDAACRADLSRLVATFREERADELEQLEAGLRKLVSAKLSDRFRRTIDNPSLLAPLPGGIDPFVPLADFAREALDARLEDILALVPAARLPENAAAQHRMRIAVKHYRYRLEILSALIGSGYQQLHAAVKGYQEVLGKIHDLDVFAGICGAAVFGPPAAELVPVAIAAKREQLFAVFASMLAASPFEQIGVRVRGAL